MSSCSFSRPVCRLRVNSACFSAPRYADSSFNRYLGTTDIASDDEDEDDGEEEEERCKRRRMIMAMIMTMMTLLPTPVAERHRYIAQR